MSSSAVVLLLLIIAANSTPVLLTSVLGSRCNQPLDGGLTLPDGRPLFGKSKTWRGVIGAILCCTLLAPLLGYSAGLGATAGAVAMLGDLLSSFIKRRLGLASSAQAPLLDQIPEAMLPGLVLKGSLGLDGLDLILVPLLFLVLEVIFSIIFFKLGIRKTPY